MSKTHISPVCVKSQLPIGSIFRKWTTIGVPFRINKQQSSVVCQCQCGTIAAVQVGSLRSGGTSGCHFCKGGGVANPNWRGGRFKHNGYWMVNVGKNKYAYEHRQVAEAALGRKLRQGEVVHHKNENKLDNRPENIEVCPSHSDHMKQHHMTSLEAARRGALANARGERHGMAKLKRRDVEKIKTLLSHGGKHRDIAKRFGVGKSTITRINTGKCWS